MGARAKVIVNINSPKKAFEVSGEEIPSTKGNPLTNNAVSRAAETVRVEFQLNFLVPTSIVTLFSKLFFKIVRSSSGVSAKGTATDHAMRLLCGKNKQVNVTRSSLSRASVAIIEPRRYQADNP